MMRNKTKIHSHSLLSGKKQLLSTKKSSTKRSRQKSVKSNNNLNVTDWNQLISDFGTIRKTIQNLSTCYSPKKSKMHHASTFSEYQPTHQNKKEKYSAFDNRLHASSKIKDQDCYSCINKSCTLQKQKHRYQNYEEKCQKNHRKKSTFNKDLNELQQSHIRLTRENKILEQQLYFKNLQKEQLLNEIQNSTSRNRDYSYEEKKSNGFTMSVAIQTEQDPLSPIKSYRNLAQNKQQKRFTNSPRVFFEDLKILKTKNQQYDKLVTDSFMQDFQMFFQRVQCNTPLKKNHENTSSQQSMLLDDLPNQNQHNKAKLTSHNVLNSVQKQYQNERNMPSKKKMLARLEEQFNQLVSQSRKQHVKSRRFQLRKQMASVARDIKQLKNS